MNAVEFTTELAGATTLAIPADIVARLPKAGMARVILLTGDENKVAGSLGGDSGQCVNDDDDPTQRIRPKVGTITSGPVKWSPESFAPLDESGMKELGLL